MIPYFNLFLYTLSGNCPNLATANEVTQQKKKKISNRKEKGARSYPGTLLMVFDRGLIDQMAFRRRIKRLVTGGTNTTEHTNVKNSK